MVGALIMKIQTTTNIIAFGDIKAGDVFLYNNEYFMKLDGEYSHDTWGDEKLNAVNLNINKLDGFDFDVEVILMNGTFMIEK